MQLGRALPIVAVVLGAMIVAVGISLQRYDDAYERVAHTSDVRLIIGRAIGHLNHLDSRSCRELNQDIEELADLTADNPIQQTRIGPIRTALEHDCRNAVEVDAPPESNMLSLLSDADAHERYLLFRRRGRLSTVRQWTLLALIVAIIGSLGVLAFAQLIQQRAMKKVRALAKQLEEISVTDELTKLYNRRGFLFVGGQAFLLAKRHGKRVAVLFADLDGLKAINDKLGHERGDEAIREFGRVLKETLRGTDVVARLGGDEFVALLYDVDEDTKVVEERLRKALDVWNAATTGPFKLATSLGVAVPAASDERPLEALLEQADQAMYEQKRAARAARAAAAAAAEPPGRKSRASFTTAPKTRAATANPDAPPDRKSGSRLSPDASPDRGTPRTDRRSKATFAEALFGRKSRPALDEASADATTSTDESPAPGDRKERSSRDRIP